MDTSFFGNNPVIKASNHKVNCVVNKKKFLFWVWLTLEHKTFCSTWLLFADWASSYQGKLLRLIKFLWQSVYLTGDLFLLSGFIRQSVYLSGVLVYFFTDKLPPCRGTYLITLSGVTSKHEKNDSTAPKKLGISFKSRFCLLWLVFRSMEFSGIFS